MWHTNHKSKHLKEAIMNGKAHKSIFWLHKPAQPNTWPCLVYRARLFFARLEEGGPRAQKEKGLAQVTLYAKLITNDYMYAHYVDTQIIQQPSLQK